MRHVAVWVVVWVGFAMGAIADPPAGSGSGSGSGKKPAPPDPGLVAKPPASFGGNADQIRAYVDSLYVYGRYLYDQGDLAGAKRYWGIIQRHYAEAKDVNVLIQNHIVEAEGKGSEQGTDPTFDDDRVPPVGGGSGSGSDPGETVPPPVECVPPVDTSGSGSGSGSGSATKPDKPDPDEEAVRKKNADDAKKLTRHFSIKTFRIGSNPTTAGSMPELFLAFECKVKPSHATIVFYGYTDKGKVFRADPMFLGPEADVTHKIAAAFKVEWAVPHGRLIAGRVEICCGKNRTCAVIIAQDLNPDKAPKHWWKTDDITGKFGFYRVGQHPEESNTLKRILH